MSEAALRERKREIDRKYAEVRKAWKKARRSECAAEAARARQWVLTEQLENIVLLMCWEAGGAVGPAVQYLRGIARQYGWPQRDDRQICEIVDMCVIAADMGRLLMLTDGRNSLHSRAMPCSALCTRVGNARMGGHTECGRGQRTEDRGGIETLRRVPCHLYRLCPTTQAWHHRKWCRAYVGSTLASALGWCLRAAACP